MSVEEDERVSVSVEEDERRVGGYGFSLKTPGSLGVRSGHRGLEGVRDR